MAGKNRTRSVVKLLFWTAVAVSLFALVFWLHGTGKLSAWYYYSAGEEGYAVNADTFLDATNEAPAMLEIGNFSRIEGLQAAPVKVGDRLPANTNGVITMEVLEEGKRAAIDGSRIRVMVPWEIQTAKGFKFKDTFKHKGIKTYPRAGVWNVVLVISLGLALGLMAEGFTDVIGIKLEKIEHFGH